MKQSIIAVAHALTIAHGIFLIIGGTSAYLSLGSKPSLIAGWVCGLPMVLGSFANSHRSRLLVLLSGAFVGAFFTYRFVTSWKLFPAGLGAGAAISLTVLNFVLFLKSGRPYKKN